MWDLTGDVGLTAHDDDVKAIGEKFQQLKTEASSLPEAEWHPVSTGYLVSGNWTEAPLYTFCARRHHTCSMLPEACRLLGEFRAAATCYRCAAKLTKLAPGTHLLPHCGPTNARIRLHLPLQVPKEKEGCAR